MGNVIRTAATLLRIGLAAGRSTPGDRLRWWGLFCAAAAVAFVVLATVATVATYDGRETRADARGPVITFGKDAALLYREGADTVGSRPFSVVFVRPLTAEAPVPMRRDPLAEAGRGSTLSRTHQDRQRGRNPDPFWKVHAAPSPRTAWLLPPNGLPMSE